MATLETTDPVRVRLRAAVPADAVFLRQWRGEWSVRRFQPLHDMTVEQLRSDVAGQRMEDIYRGRGDKFQWLILVDEEPAGWVTLVINNWEHGLAEVGYALSSAFQGRGLMARALVALVAELFSRTRIERIEARCAIDNVASQRVLERAGFEREGRLRAYFRLHGRRVDNYLYAILRGPGW